jgi:DNA polymerase III sliding clamp (beta) subunit (PCNA family)
MLYSRHNFEVADFCAGSELRPELAGILVTPTETAATDSFTLVEVSVPSKDNSEGDFPAIPGHAVKARDDAFIFPKEAAKDVQKSIPKNAKDAPGMLERAAVIETDKGLAGFVTTDLAQTRPTIAHVIEGRFPDYKQLFPTAAPKFVVTVNAKYLERLAKFFAGFDKDRKVTIKTYGVNEPILFEASNKVQTARALFMPLRTAPTDAAVNESSES